MNAIDAWVESPHSSAIAQELQRTGALTCKHRRNPCYLRCGVRREREFGRWEIIPYIERKGWKARVLDGVRGP